MAKKYKDGEILAASNMMIDEDSVVYGANGHYAVGAYYDLYENYQEVSGTTAASMFYNGDGTIDEDLQNAKWLKEL